MTDEEDPFVRLQKYGLQRGRPKKVADGDPLARPVTLKELGITKQEAYEARQLAAIPKDLFEEIMDDVFARPGRVPDTRAIIHEYRRRCQQPPQRVGGFLAIVRAWNAVTGAERMEFFDGLLRKHGATDEERRRFFQGLFESAKRGGLFDAE
jgi:hypothetical protein